MKLKTIIAILLFSLSIVTAQNNFKLVTTIPVNADFFTTDKQGNVYVVKANELSKYNRSGKLLYKYSNKNLGNIDFVDPSNMLRLLLFYKNFSQVLFLDNTLTLSGEPISLDRMGYQQTQLVCSSYNNGMWLYDQQNIGLVRLDQTFNKTQETGNLSILLNIDLQPNALVEFDNKVYLTNPKTGVLVFDIYGTYYKTVPVKNAECVQPNGTNVFFKTDSLVKSYSLKTIDETEFTMPNNNFQKFRLEQELLLLQTKEGIEIYTEK